MDIREELLRFADGVRHIRRCVEQGTLSEEEASQMCDKLAEFYAAQIVGKSGRAESPQAAQAASAEAVSLLVELGIETLTAQQLASQCSMEEIEGWCEYARQSNGLTNPAGLVVSRLRERVPPPRSPDNGNGRRRYISGEYAEYIQS